MKYIRTFENNTILYISNDLKIIKYRGKITIKCDDGSSSCALGCAELLDTKYEKIEEIRNIENDKISRRMISDVTVECIIRRFLSSMAEYGDIKKYISSETIRPLIEKFSYQIRNIVQNSKTLGENLDEFRKIRDEVVDFQRLKSATNKYNL